MDDKMQYCIPGERLASEEEYKPGKGTHVRHGYICASLAGSIIKEKDATGQIHMFVKSKHSSHILPELGSIVICRIISITTRFAKCLIEGVNNVPLLEPFRGMIRREDVRAKEIDKVEIYKSFHPGDIVLAKVLSLGDATFYLLTTAEDELGVVVAHSEAGEQMIPISWQEMQCPVSYAKEYRKVARPQKEFLDIPNR